MMLRCLPLVVKNLFADDFDFLLIKTALLVLPLQPMLFLKHNILG